MNELVERVARAIWETLPSADRPYDVATPSQIVEVHTSARAAIAAMREPTEAMLAAAHWKPGFSPIAIWAAMIDAALSDG